MTVFIDKYLKLHGLCVLGQLATEPKDGLPPDAEHIVLIGPDVEMWRIFSASSFANDGEDNPLDRWSYHVLSDVADAVGGRALFPFGGPPHRPFIDWAQRSGRVWVSPVGLLVHDTAGLFASFRGAIALSGPPELPKQAPAKPCNSCEKPCVGACPVNALRPGFYDVPACKSHVASAAGTACRTQGCAVRRACPVGRSARGDAQSAFHMRAFIGA